MWPDSIVIFLLMKTDMFNQALNELRVNRRPASDDKARPISSVITAQPPVGVDDDTPVKCDP